MALFPGHRVNDDDDDLSGKEDQFQLGLLNDNGSQSVITSTYGINGNGNGNGNGSDSNDMGHSTRSSRHHHHHHSHSRVHYLWRKFRQRLPYYIPILSWLPKYQRSYLPGDLAAGLSLAVVMVPQSIAYSSLVHVPANMGLYTAFYPTLIYALLGSSPHLSVGPETATAIIIGSMAASLAPATGPDGHPAEDDVVKLITQFTFVCGVLTSIMGVMRLGFIDSILSAPMLAGFIQAEALILLVEQFPRLIGIKPCPPSTCDDSGGYIPKAIYLFENLHDAHWQTSVISIICITTLGAFGFAKARWPHIKRLVIFPHVALVVGVAICVSWLMDLSSQGVDVIGRVSAGLVPPSMHVPSTKDLGTMLPLSVTVMVIGFVASQVASKRMAIKYGYNQSANRDLVAFGMASLVGSCFGSWPGFGSLTRTKVSDAAGCRTAMAGLFSALLVLLVILFVTPAFYHMPKAVTASIIFTVAISLLDISELRFIIACRQWRDAALLCCMMIITFCFGITTGIFFAFGACLLLVVRVTTSAQVTMLGRTNRSDGFGDLADVTVDAQSIEGLLIFKIEGALHFANAAKLRESTRRVEYYGALHVHPSEKLAPVQLSCAIFDMTSLTQVDSTAASVLLDIIRHYHERDVRVCFVHLRGEIRQLFDRAGIGRELESHDDQPYFEQLRDAVVTLQEHIQQRSRTHSKSQHSHSHSSNGSHDDDNNSDKKGHMIPSSSSSINGGGGGGGMTPSVSTTSVTGSGGSASGTGVDRTPLLSTLPHGHGHGHGGHERKSSISIIITGSPDRRGSNPLLTTSPVIHHPNNSHGRPSLSSSSRAVATTTTIANSGDEESSLAEPPPATDDHGRPDIVDDDDAAHLTQNPLVLLQALGRQPSLPLPLPVLSASVSAASVSVVSSPQNIPPHPNATDLGPAAAADSATSPSVNSSQH